MERVCALLALSYSDPAYLPGDDRLSYAIGRSVLLARPLPQLRYVDRRGRSQRRSDPLRSLTIRAVGEHFRTLLTPLVASVVVQRRKAAAVETTRI